MDNLLQFSFGNSAGLLFLVVCAEQAGLPIPAAPWLLAAGALCARSGANPAIVISVAVAACLLPDLAWFYVGRHGGKRILSFLCRFALPQSASIEQLERSFVRHGMPFVALAKFIPGVSVIAPPLAGALGTGTGRFVLFDLLGSVLYAGFYVLLGAAFNNQVQAILAVLNRLGAGCIVLCILVLVGYFAFKHNPLRRTTRQLLSLQESRIQTI